MAAAAPPKRYGARNMTRRSYWLAQVALGCGSVLEWFDFSCVAVLEPVITTLFFPPGTAKSQLPFWIIFSVTFLSRPFGGLVFAAIADMYGRKPCLLASVITMGVPSVLIGCLPTYKHIGLAAPILLALCRLVQGLALGGEYTAAVITAYELSPADAKNLGGAVAFAAGSVGTILGVAVPMVVYVSVSEEALLQWGWRVPFLASVVTAGVALLLRTLMVEPDEFLDQRERENLLLRAGAAGQEEEADEAARHDEGGGGGGGGKEVLGAGKAAVADNEGAAAGIVVVDAAAGDDAAARTSSSSGGSDAATLATVAVRPPPVCSAPLSGDGKAGAADEDAAAAAAAAATAAAAIAAGAAASAAARAPWWQPAACRRRPPAAAIATTSALGSPPTAAPPPPRRAHRPIPVRAAFTQHGGKIALQCLFTAASTASAFAFTAWLPLLLLTPPALLPRTTAYGMVLITVVLSIPVGLLAARVCDRGLVRPVTLSVCAILAGAAVILLYFLVAVERLAVPGRHAALVAATLVCVVPHNVVYGSLANVMSRIYPAQLRVTAFSAAHNVASSVFGGFAPLIMSALQTAWPWKGPAVYLASLCAVSASAGLLMMRRYDGINALPAEAELLREAERAAAEAEAAEGGATAALKRAAAAAVAGGDGKATPKRPYM